MSNISVGDLVYVARPTPCCGNNQTVNNYFVVKELRVLQHPLCTFCSTLNEADVFALDAEGYGYHLYRLKKVPPLPELEERKEEIVA